MEATYLAVVWLLVPFLPRIDSGPDANPYAHPLHLKSLVVFLGPRVGHTLPSAVAWDRLRPRPSPEAAAGVFA